MEIQFRVLAPNESNAYRHIRLESLREFPDSFCATYQDAIKTEKLAMEFDIENQTVTKFVFGAFSNTKLIGICTLVKDDQGGGTLYQMYVQKGFQGKNLGLRLLEGTINEAKTRFGEIPILLEVSKTNLPAFTLYKKAGFVIDTSIENADFYVMKFTK